MSTIPLEEILDLLIQKRPPADDPTGQATHTALTTWLKIRNIADHQITTHTATLTPTANRAGTTPTRMLITLGCPPAAATRFAHNATHLDTLCSTTGHAADARLPAETVDAITRGITTIARRCPTPLSDTTRHEYETDLLTQALSGATPAEIRTRAHTIATTLTDTAGAIPACDDKNLDTLSHTITDDRRIDLRANITQVVGEKLIAMIDERAIPRPEPDGSPDRRTADQRRVDALELLLDQAALGAATDTIGAPRTQISLLIPADGGDPATMPWTGAITHATARRLSCDGTITEIIIDGDTVPLQMGRERRLFPPHIRKAVTIRDHTCIACGAPPSHCQVHHIEHWTEHDGETNLDNGCLLCQRCHTRVHHHGWNITLGHDRHPWLIPPTDIDPHQRPLPAHNRRTMTLDAIAA